MNHYNPVCSGSTLDSPEIVPASVARIAKVLFLVATILLVPACKTDQAAQQQINQMRADNVALMDHYVSLRAYTEKLQKELEEQGKPLPKNARPLGSLPLVYPPPGTNSRLIDQYGSADQSSSLGEVGKNGGSTNPSSPYPVSPASASFPAGDDLPGQSWNNRSSNAGNQSAGNQSAGNLFPVQPAAFQSGTASSGLGGSQAVATNQIRFITIKPQRHHGYEKDHLPGDDGFKVLLQPRNSTGELRLVPGEVILKLFDTSQLPDQKQEDGTAGKLLGRWKFSESNLKSYLTGEGGIRPSADGIPLKVSFGGTIPANSQLLVQVNYKNPEGQILQTKEVVRLDLTGMGRATEGGQAGQVEALTGPKKEEVSWEPNRSK